MGNRSRTVNGIGAIIAETIGKLSNLRRSNTSRGPGKVLFFTNPANINGARATGTLTRSVFNSRGTYVHFSVDRCELRRDSRGLFNTPPKCIKCRNNNRLAGTIGGEPFDIVLFSRVRGTSPAVLSGFLRVLRSNHVASGRNGAICFKRAVVVFADGVNLAGRTASPRGTFESAPRHMPAVAVRSPAGRSAPRFEGEMARVLARNIGTCFGSGNHPRLLGELNSSGVIIFRFVGIGSTVSVYSCGLNGVYGAVGTRGGVSVVASSIVRVLRRGTVLRHTRNNHNINGVLRERFLGPLTDFVYALPSVPSILEYRDNRSNVRFRIVLNRG